ncbi:putative caffeoyl-CoA O-methyltransferase 1 [Oratosquilla oratoria]|uniref:putative caffeoyl-CoA O-methyltransferase 1 n=1 Tax=Oratosquilla oratoria TaxID=337810 RepID=UPI003F76B35A
MSSLRWLSFACTKHSHSVVELHQCWKELFSSPRKLRMDTNVSKSYYAKADPIQLYVRENSIRMTDVQKKLQDETLKHHRSVMMGDADVTQLMGNLIRSIGATKVLDIGVFTGVSALSAALALPPQGKVHALDINMDYIKIGQPFWKEAGVGEKIDVHIGPASETLQKFIDEGQAGTFDFAFIDADKVGYLQYYEQCLVLLRVGGIIAVDNTLWGGSVIDPEDNTPDTVAIRKFNAFVHKDDRIGLSFLKISDGLTLCFKK